MTRAELAKHLLKPGRLEHIAANFVAENWWGLDTVPETEAALRKTLDGMLEDEK